MKTISSVRISEFLVAPFGSLMATGLVRSRREAPMKKRDRRLDLRRRLASPALAEPARGRQLRARRDQPADDHGDD